MEKDIFLANLEKFLKNVICGKIYANASHKTKKILEKDVVEFIKESVSEYTTEELIETFTSANNAIGLFLEYRDAKIMTGDVPIEGIIFPMADTPPPAPPKPKEWQEPLTGMEFILVSGGCFQMGCGDWDNEGLEDEKPGHEVCLDGFWIGKYPVTVGQYMIFVRETNSHSPCWMEEKSKYNIKTGIDDYYKKLGGALTGEDYPVVGVSWNDAVVFAKWLSETSDSTFYLPTEAEWEYAARSRGQYEKFPGGQDVDYCAWYYDNSCGTIHPVGKKAPNGIGIYDMSGNVSEWCMDMYSKFAYSNHPCVNPVFTGEGSGRVVRGGSWTYGRRDVRCTDRSLFVPDVRTYDLGFRLVKKPV